MSSFRLCTAHPESLRAQDTGLCLTLCDHQAPLSMGFSGQGYRSRLPFLSPGDLPDSGIKLESLASPSLVGGFFTTELPGKPLCVPKCIPILKQNTSYLQGFIKDAITDLKVSRVNLSPAEVCFLRQAHL